MITYQLLNLFRDALEASLITNVDESDTSRAGVVKLGSLQGEPEPDIARISAEVFPNDPDKSDDWLDEIVEVEIPCGSFWERKFTIKYTLLLESSAETLARATELASIIKERVELTISKMKYSSIIDPNEKVVRGCLDIGARSRLKQGGGPPDTYIFRGVYQFSVLTHQTTCGD